MFPINPPPTDLDAYSVTVTPVAAAKGGVFTLNMDGSWRARNPNFDDEAFMKSMRTRVRIDMDGNWERVARSRPVIVNSIAPAVPLGPVNKTLLGMVVTSALISILALAGWGGLIYWAFSR